MKPTIRASSLPLAMTCPAAVLNPDGLTPVHEYNDAAALGTVIHRLIEETIRHGTVNLDEVRQQTSPDEFERATKLFDNFLAVWREASVYMTRPVTEWAFSAELDVCTLTGHIDVHHADPARAFILDWKSGRQHESHYHQMAAYAYGLWHARGRPEPYTVYVSAVYLEDNSVHPYEFTAEALARWANDVQETLKNPRYVTGRRCAGCPLQDTCPAYREFGRAAVSFLTGRDLPGGAWAAMTPDERGAAADAMYVVERAIARAKLGLRNLVYSQAAGGGVDVGNGSCFTIVEETERFVDVGRAAAVLARLAPGYERVGQFKLEPLLAYAASRAPKGLKTKARNALKEALESAGAVTKRTSLRMFRRPASEEKLTEE